MVRLRGYGAVPAGRELQAAMPGLDMHQYALQAIWQRVRVVGVDLNQGHDLSSDATCGQLDGCKAVPTACFPLTLALMQTCTILCMDLTGPR